MYTKSTFVGLSLFVAMFLFAPQSSAAAQTECGKASWYALKGMTASGVRHDPQAMTAAHRTLAFGTKVRVENLANGRAVVVKIVDRGPFIRGRVIDVSKGAAKELGFVGKGVTRVRVSPMPGDPASAPSCS